MRRRFLLFLPTCAALLLGLAWPSGAPRNRLAGPEILLEMQDPGGVLVGAREPAILMPGPRLRWSVGEEVAGRVFQDGAWVEQETQEPVAPWKSGLWSGLEESSGIAMLSAASLRNGIRKDSTGRIAGWSPDPAIDTTGGVHLVEDRFQDGSFDVVYRAPQGQAMVVAGSAAFEAHASVAVDASAHVWIAWDEGSTSWGRGDGLRTQRTLRLVRYDGATWSEIPLPELSQLVGDAASATAFPASAELPRLVAEAGGPLWMFYRVMIPFTDPESRTASRKVAWVQRATCLSDQGWSKPITLPSSDGPNHDSLAAMDLPEGGVLAAWTTDQRLSRFEAMRLWSESVMGESTLQVAELRCVGSGPGAEIEGSMPWEVTALEDPSENVKAGDPLGLPQPTDGSHRLWGDLHRHSDLSRCSMHTDGSVPDQYRYAASTGALDFVAITDHHQHIRPATWAFLLDCAERFQEPGGLQPLFGFEAAFPDGHRNLVSDRRSAVADLPFQSSLDAGVQDLDPEFMVAIPHQMAARNSILDWSTRVPALETQLEIYQRRGSYEAATSRRTARNTQPGALYMMDHLRAGERFGLLASSDHQFSEGAFAVVYAEDRSRSAILEALQSRRSYAATARIGLEVDLGGLKMGAAGQVDVSAALAVKVDAGSPIARVEVVRNGKVAYTWDGAHPSAAGAGSSDLADGILTLRYGKLEGAPNLPLHGVGFEFGSAVLFDGEAGVASVAPEGSAWNPGIFLRYASRRAQALGGWAIPIRFTETTEPRSVSMGDGQGRTTWTEAELRAGSEWKRRHKNRPVSIRLEGPPFGKGTLQESWSPGDWQAGDWVYVRVVRADAAMAWSSPIWIDAAR